MTTTARRTTRQGPCDSVDELPSSAGCSFIANRQLEALQEVDDGVVIANPNSSVDARVTFYQTPIGTNQEVQLDEVVLSPYDSHVFHLTSDFVHRRQLRLPNRWHVIASRATSRSSPTTTRHTHSRTATTRRSSCPRRRFGRTTSSCRTARTSRSAPVSRATSRSSRSRTSRPWSGGPRGNGR